jgi:putative adhesin
MRILAALPVVLVLALSASPALAQRLPFEKSFDAAGISTLDVSTMRGKIHIVPGDADRIVVGGAVTVRIGVDVPLNALERAQKIAANPPIERAGNTVRLRPPADAADQRAVTVNYEVRVPANTTVVSVSDSGETTIVGITGAVEVRTQSGAIALHRLGGAATVSTGSGAVVVEGTRGPLKVATSSSAFTARGLGGNLHVRTMSGAVNAGFEGVGDIDVETGSSAIQLRGVRGAVTAASRSGRITVEGKPDRQWAVSTGSGSVDVAIASPPVTLDAASGSGSVQVAGATVNGTVAKRAVNGAIGSGGPPVRISTRSGSIRFTVGH